MNGFRKPLIPGALVLFLALGAWLPACSAQDKDAAVKGATIEGTSDSGRNTVLAIVDGKPITDADVRAGSSEQFLGLQREYEKNVHDLLESSLQTTINDRLVEAEAKAKGQTKE